MAICDPTAGGRVRGRQRGYPLRQRLGRLAAGAGLAALLAGSPAGAATGHVGGGAARGAGRSSRDRGGPGRFGHGAGGARPTAGEWPNPDLAGDYTEDSPHWHVVLRAAARVPMGAQPPDPRRPRRQRGGLSAAGTGACTGALRRRPRICCRRRRPPDRETAASQAEEGERLVSITEERRAAGDASDLDVDLARVNAGQLRSALLTDSLNALTGTLELQSPHGHSRGFTPDRRRGHRRPGAASPAGCCGRRRRAASGVGPGRPGDTAPPPAALALAAATAERTAAGARLSALRRGCLPAPAVRLGFENGLPPGEEQGLLPTFGLSLPIPIFNRNRGAVHAAEAEAERTAAELEGARRAAALAVSRAAHEYDLAAARLGADRQALESAARVAELFDYRVSGRRIPTGQRAGGAKERTGRPAAGPGRCGYAAYRGGRAGAGPDRGGAAMSGLRRWIWLALGVVALVVFFVARRSGAGAEGEAEVPVVEAATATARVEPFPVSVAALGTVVPGPGAEARPAAPAPTRVTRCWWRRATGCRPGSRWCAGRERLGRRLAQAQAALQAAEQAHGARAAAGGPRGSRRARRRRQPRPTWRRPAPRWRRPSGPSRSACSAPPSRAWSRRCARTRASRWTPTSRWWRWWTPSGLAIALPPLARGGRAGRRGERTCRSRPPLPTRGVRSRRWWAAGRVRGVSAAVDSTTGSVEVRAVARAPRRGRCGWARA